MSKPIRLHVTLGDPTGIGPEVVVRGLANLDGPSPVIHGHPEVLERACALVGVRLPNVELREPTLPASFKGPFADPGQAQLAALDQAVAAAGAGEVDGLVTAPIQKATIRRAGFDFPGHTDYLAHRAGVPVIMMFVSPRLKVSLVTIHLPLAQVAAAMTAERLTLAVRLTAEALVQDFGVAAPRIAVAGLNPHAGEAGVLGHTEQRVMEPALAAALPDLRRSLGEGLEVEGPLPADTIFRRAVDGEYDAVVAAYHDQALIPVKLLAFERAVNLTLGLPFVRTSPAHGTAHDIAWKGRADGRSMAAAMALAVSLAAARYGHSPHHP